MSLFGTSASLRQTSARASACLRRHRPTSEAQHIPVRHASTSRVTLAINPTVPRLAPASSRRVNAQSNNSNIASSSSSAPKPRRLLQPSPGRGVSNAFIEEARRDMQLRGMPHEKADFKWLREARHELYTLNAKQTQLQTEHKQLTTEINRLFQIASGAVKKGKHTDKGLEEDSSEADADPQKDAGTSDAEQVIQEMRERARKIKQELEAVHKQQEVIRNRSHMFRLSWPNHCHPDVPVGAQENAVLVCVKDPLNILPTQFDVMKEPWNQSVIQAKHFPEGPGADPKREHLSLAASATNAEVDIASGALATGSSWPYLLGSISLLEHALSQYAMSIVVGKGFLPVSPPDVVRADLADRCGFRPRDEKAKQTYFLQHTKSKGSQQEPQGSGDLCLAATAEIPLAGLLAARTFDASMKAEKKAAAGYDEASVIQQMELPIKLAALGHAFRAEAGARGADTRGLYRVHQFSKIEMFVATHGDVTQSNTMLEELRGIQEQLIGGLGLPYRVLDMPTQELGASAYRKYDIEVWMPGRGSWGEVSSASNCTDYQSRRLGIKLKHASSPKNDEMSSATVHTLNATAAAIPRLIVAILENHGVENGKLVLPDTLKRFWLAGDKDPNVTWLHTGKVGASRLQRALAQVRSSAKRNGTDAPTMVASFLLLHELTAIVPLIVLFYAFGALGVGTAVLQWLLGDSEEGSREDDGENKSVAARFRAWARLKEERFERYCRKRGYLGFEKQDAETIDAANDLGKSSHLAGSFANMAAAYILVKALIPVRIGVSVALAGPFSRTVLEPLKHLVRRAGSLRRSPGKAGVPS